MTGFSAELSPRDAVRGGEGGQSFHVRSAQSLILLRLGNAGAPVEHRREIVGSLAGHLGRQDDVVVPCPCYVEQPEVRLCPFDAVGALRVAGHLWTVSGRAPVVHTVDAVVLEHGDVRASAAFPRSVVLDRRTCRLRFVELERRSIDPVDQVVVDEQLAPVTEPQRLAGCVCHGGPRSSSRLIAARTLCFRHGTVHGARTVAARVRRLARPAEARLPTCGQPWVVGGSGNLPSPASSKTPSGASSRPGRRPVP